MGFYSGIVVLSGRKIEAREPTSAFYEVTPPSTVELFSKEFTLWELQSYLNFGRTTRMEKLTHPRFSRLNYKGRSRASICVVSSIFPKLCAKCNEGVKEHFAPPFCFSEGKERYEWTRAHLDFSVLKGGEHYVMPPEDLEIWGEIYNPRMMTEHNRLVASDDTVFKEYIQKSYGIIRDAPFLWDTCTNLASWIREMEAGDSEERRQLELDSDSVAIVRAWRAYLEEIGKTGAKALFVFDMPVLEMDFP